MRPETAEPAPQASYPRPTASRTGKPCRLWTPGRGDCETTRPRSERLAAIPADTSILADIVEVLATRTA